MKNVYWILVSIYFIACTGKTKESSEQTVAAKPVASFTSSIPLEEVSYYKKLISHFVDSAFGSSRFNGSILVAKNGEILFEEYRGFRDPRVRRDSITPSSPFHLASVSKTFTAMAIMKLSQEGKLKIEDSVSTYLAGFPCKGVTIKTLLNHRSGIPNYVHYMERLGWDRKKFITNQDVLDFIIQNHQRIQIGNPDRGFSYSNTNYALLALVIEKVSGMSFPEFMRLVFFEPLGMKDTYVFTPADSARSLSSFFSSGREYAFDYLDLVYGDKNIYSTVRDLLKWDQALSNGTYFSRETLEAAYSGYSFEKRGINNYGLGWRMQILPNGKRFIYHNGWWHGNRTAFYRMLDEKATIIALSNNDNTRVYGTRKLADAFGNYFRDDEEPPALPGQTAFKSSPNSQQAQGSAN